METTLDYRIARRRMVKEQLQPRGITEERLLEAFLKIPRHLFIDPALGSRAYDDCSFPIGYDQTISQPFTIAFMLQALDIGPDDRVLEIGTGLPIGYPIPSRQGAIFNREDHASREKC